VLSRANYGHAARKATWLYLYGLTGPELPELTWGSSASPDRVRLEQGFHSREERARWIKTGSCQRLSARQRSLTPEPFANLLLDLARRCRP